MLSKFGRHWKSLILLIGKGLASLLGIRSSLQRWLHDKCRPILQNLDRSPESSEVNDFLFGSLGLTSYT